MLMLNVELDDVAEYDRGRGIVPTKGYMRKGMRNKRVLGCRRD